MDPRRRCSRFAALVPLLALVSVAGATAAGPVAGGPIRISIAGALVTEGDGRSVHAIFALRLSRSPPRPVSVRFATANGSARAGTDYVARRGTVVFRAGQLAKRVRVPVVGDTLPETTETFFLLLSRPRGAEIKAGRAMARIAASDLPSPFTLRTELTGAQYVPAPGHPTGRGTVVLMVDAAQEQVAFTITVSQMNVGESGICRGRAGEEPSGVLRFSEEFPQSGTLSGSRRLELKTLLELHDAPANFCAAAHEPSRATGIRGQLSRG
jgi:hypothetical protein